MQELSTIWRPSQNIRAIALGLPFRENRVLLSAVTRDDGTVTGWRPLGGGIEFGESAQDALRRELFEELEAEARMVRRLGIIENIFTHEDETGHEIVFLFEVELLSPGLAAAEEFVLEDGPFRDLVAWKPLADFHSAKERLLPDGLLPLVPAGRAP